MIECLVKQMGEGGHYQEFRWLGCRLGSEGRVYIIAGIRVCAVSEWGEVSRVLRDTFVLPNCGCSLCLRFSTTVSDTYARSWP